MSYALIQEHVTAPDGATHMVSTVRLAVEHPGGKWFETYVFPSDGEKVTDWMEEWGERFVTEAEARERHVEVVAGVLAGAIP